MRPNTLTNTLKTFHSIRRPCLIESSPGVGKTQIVRQAAREMGIGFIHKHVPTLQPEDWALPCPTADRKSLGFIPADWMPLEGRDGFEDEGIILLDEAPQGDNSLQKSIANFTQERECYGYRLKPGWTIVMTGNRVSDRAGANRVLSHLRNRVTTIELEPSLDDWCDWANDNGVRPELVSFARLRPDLLNDHDPQRDINPTPRSWAEGVSPILDRVPREAEFEVIKGAVGEGAASEFTGYLRIYRDLPDIDKLLSDPEKAPVPDKPAVRYAISAAIAQRADEGNFANVLAYARRLPPEFTVMTVLDSMRRTPDVANTKAFTSWAATDGARILQPK